MANHYKKKKIKKQKAMNLKDVEFIAAKII